MRKLCEIRESTSAKKSGTGTNTPCKLQSARDQHLIAENNEVIATTKCMAFAVECDVYEQLIDG
jgi:hypothetical protein